MSIERQEANIIDKIFQTQTGSFLFLAIGLAICLTAAGALAILTSG